MIVNITPRKKNCHINFREKILLSGFSCLLMMLFPLGNAFSQSLFRTAGVLTTASNYSTGSLPTSSTDVKLTTTTTNLDLSLTSLSMRSLNTNSGLAYTMNYATNSSINQTLTLGGSNFTNPVSGITNDLIYVGSGSLSLLGTNTGGGTGVTNLSLASSGFFDVASGASLSIGTTSGGGTLSGSKFAKSGAGTLTLYGVNTSASGVTLSAGTLNINNASALGTGQFSISGGVIDNTSGSSLTLTGYSSSLWSGNFGFGGTGNLNLGSETVYLGANTIVTTSGASSLIVGGTISGSLGGYSLTKAGSGILTLAGANNFGGTLTLSNGTLNINNASALNTGTFYISNGASIDNTSGGSITNTNGRATANSWGGSFTFVGTNNLNLGTGGVALTANSAVATNAGVFTVGGIISGGYSLAKSGIGTLVLSGINTFTGGMTLSGGTLDINNASALGTGIFTVSSLSTIDNTSGGAITNSKNNPQSWAGDFTFTGSNSLNLGTGAVTLTGNTNITTTASTLTIGGGIGGSYDISKSGSGTLVLKGTGTYTGTTTINAGTLQTGAANVIPSGSNLILNGGTLSTGNTVGFAEGSSASPMGTLSLSSSSTIALGTGTHKLYFSDSHSTSWTGGTTLSITGWTGTTGASGAGTSGRIFVGASSSGLTAGQLSQITFSGYTSGAVITSSGEIVPSASPTITVSGILSALSTTYGTASSTTSFTVSGTNLSPGVVIMPPTGFEVSQTSSTSGFGGSGGTITVAAIGGIVSTTTIYVRLAAGVSVGSYSGNIKCQSSVASPGVVKTVVAISSTISKKSLTAVGTLVFPSSKVYDGGTTATPTSGAASLQTSEALGAGTSSDGIPYTGDVVSLIGSAAYNYNSANVLSATTITESGLSLTGAQSGNYSLTAPTFSATITTATATITPDASQSKVYGASDPVFTFSSSPSVSTSGALSRVSGENVGTYSYVLGTLSAGSNYTLVLGGSNTFAITPATVTITPDASQSKVFGTSDPVFTFSSSPSVSTSGALSRGSGENVGTYSYTLGTLSAGSNYTLVLGGSNTFAITPATVTVTPNSGQSKVYGTSDPVFTFSTSPSVSTSGALSRVSGENVGTYSYTLGTLSGGSNYTLSLGGSNTFSITVASLTVTANDRSTAYGTALPLGTSAFSTIGLVSGDAVSSVTLLYTSLSTVPSTVPAATYSNSIVPSAASGTGLSNYSISYTNGTLTVTGVGGTWTGLTNTDYGTGSNWSDGNVPGSGAAVTIPSLANQPILGGNFTVASLSLASSATISLNGHTFTVSGAVTSGSSTSYFKTTSASTLIVAGGTIYFDPSNNTLGNLTINGSTTLGNALNITGVFTPTSGTFTTGGYLTLKSTSETATAVVGVVGGSVSGNVTVERFVKQGLRTFRDLCPEVSGAGSVFANWQESGVTNNGYGVFITGISGYAPGGVNPATGFDVTVTGAGSMQTFGSGVASGTWSYITSTKGLSLSPYLGYRLLIRGNRAGNLFASPQPTSMWSDATLRASGSLVTGTVTYTTTGGSVNILNSNANTYSFVGNPYACPINWNTLTRSHLTATYLYLDPTFVNNLGNSTYVSYNTVSGTSSSPGPTNVNQYIQPGEAFWVQNDASGSASSLTIHESDKVLPSTAAETAIFGTNSINRLAFSLLKGSGKVDAAVAVFRTDFTTEIGEEDSRKFNNQGENLTILNKEADLSIDGTSLPKAGDVLQLHLYNLTAGSSYQLKVDPSVFKSEGTSAYIYDAFLNTKKSVDAITTVDFKVSSDVASYEKRFSIVFAAAKDSKASPIEANVIATASSIKVSPNPVSGNSFSLHLGGLQVGKYTVNIYNALGLKVFSSNLYHDATDLHAVQLGKNLSVGTYVVKVIGTDKSYQTLLTIAK